MIPDPTTLKKVLTSVDVAAAALVASGQLPGWLSQMLGAVCLVLTYLGYGDTKTQLAKLGQATMLALLVAQVWLVGALVVAGCATLRAMTGDFATCAKTDLGALVKNEDGQIEPLATAVAQAIDGNADGLETWLGGLATLVGIEAIECAEVAYEDTHPSTAGSGAVVAMRVRPPGLDRVKAWIIRTRKAGK